jgi:hypothetical protein
MFSRTLFFFLEGLQSVISAFICRNILISIKKLCLAVEKQNKENFMKKNRRFIIRANVVIFKLTCGLAMIVVCTFFQ